MDYTAYYVVLASILLVALASRPVIRAIERKRKAEDK